MTPLTRSLSLAASRTSFLRPAPLVRTALGWTRFYSSSAATDSTMFSQLKQDLKASMRSKDQVRLGVIRSVLSAVTYHEKALIMKGRSAEESKIEAQQDPSVVSIVQSAQKKRRDAVALYQGAGRSDLAEQEAKELAILQSFLPEPYTPAEIDAHVQAAITATEAKSIRDLGRVIKSLTLDPARAPKAQLAETAKRLLASAK